TYAGQLRYGLYQARAREAHVTRVRSGRHAPDGGTCRSDGRPAENSRRARAALRQGGCRNRHLGTLGRTELCSPSAPHRSRHAALEHALEHEEQIMGQAGASLPLQPRQWVTFEAHPDRYRHWKLSFDGPVATLAMDVDEEGGLMPGYTLKLNSYDLGVDIELHDALQRLRFEHPQVRSVVLTSAKERIFCSGANIFMLGLSAHAWKVNFCKFTNE